MRDSVREAADCRAPRALDLFCCAGGAGMGLHLAGFEVVGVDIEPQPRYPFPFVQADALNPPFNLMDFDFIWASPPCQNASDLRHRTGKTYPDLIPATRALLRSSGRPYVIENVVGAELANPIMLCGSSFGLGVWRHRLFEASFWMMEPSCNHALCPKPVDVTGTGGASKKVRVGGGGRSRKPRNLEHAREVMGIDWMDRAHLSQAIPPAYAEFIGRAAMGYIAQNERASSRNNGAPCAAPPPTILRCPP